ncbi:MAG: YihY/virulence factor BrkB family protein [Proteobacteria bacterium]|nr:MAG: YihY/virulence factor BrkB family protein [Pseudomonadota bacterium]
MACFSRAMTAGLKGITLKGVHGASWKRFFADLWTEINEDNIFNGAAALAFYLTLAIFPALIFFLNLLPYLPIPDQSDQIYGLLRQAMPSDAASALTDTVKGIVTEKRQGLLSFGAIFTLWAAMSGMYAIMQQLNMTYDVVDGRGIIKVRLVALALTMGFASCLIGALLLTLLGDQLQNLLAVKYTLGAPLLILFQVVRWAIITLALSAAFAMIYYYGPDVKQEFRFITPGSIMGVLVLATASLGFKIYVENFGTYNATYGSIGAIIVLMLWLNIAGLVILFGSEVNALVEHYNPSGKVKGEKIEGENGHAAHQDEPGTDRPPIPSLREEHDDERKKPA